MTRQLKIPADGVTDTVRLQLAVRLLGFGFDRIVLEPKRYIITETLRMDNPPLLTLQAAFA